MQSAKSSRSREVVEEIRCKLESQTSRAIQSSGLHRSPCALYPLTLLLLHFFATRALPLTVVLQLCEYRNTKIGRWLGSRKRQDSSSPIQNNVRCNVVSKHRSAISMVSIFRGPGWWDGSYRGVRNATIERDVHKH